MRGWPQKALTAFLSAGIAIALLAPVAQAGSSKSLTGTWSGTIAHAMRGKTLSTVHLRIVIDAAQTGGSWYVNAECQGPLRDDGISWGYHHYAEELAKGSTCVGGAIDCLQRQGANVFDTVTPPSSISYKTSATLTSVKR
jgi:hypothetical protein